MMPTMPHITYFLSSARPLRPALLLGPALVAEHGRGAGLLDLLGALDDERVRGDVAGDDAARAGDRAGADGDRRDQRRVRADEGAGADDGLLLEEAVVVAGDRPGADVGALAHLRVADIAEMVGLCTSPEPRSLHLDEIADVDLGAELGARAQARERPDDRALADARAGE